ncbi:major royal jelly protein 3-like [Scaptodrosophila lebanonensis]|uniref:Major royal jelly protein 3-like n=1 Tax=Drosophila lebanonensis TaxID=7225 RepID=A0A6J2UIJ4_DROLE|nr:major royal jelly protein 3-like [Scaptodrosophila lebanonensis]
MMAFWPQYRLFALLLVIHTGSQIYTHASHSSNRIRSIQTVTQWNQLEYAFPTAQDVINALTTGELLPDNGTPIDVQPQYLPNGLVRIFTSIPRFLGGIPFTLATVSSKFGDNGPLLQPYPSLDWHNKNGENCDQITSAFRVTINECNQMWVLDSGVIGRDQVCPPQLLLFNLGDDRLLHRFRFPNTTYVPGGSLLIAPSLLVRDPPPHGQCEHTMIYIADVSNHGLVIYDQYEDVAWRAEHRFMYPDPDYGLHTIAGESFTLMDGIFTVNNDKRNLYFHPLASRSEYSVPLSVLNNASHWVGSVDAMQDQFVQIGKRNSECTASAMDSRYNLYCVTLNPVELIVWNVNTRYNPRNFAVLPANPKDLQFVSGMKVVRNAEGHEELWLFSNRFQKVAAGTLTAEEVNFRILRRQLDDVQSGAFFPHYDIDYDDYGNRL